MASNTLFKLLACNLKAQLDQFRLGFWFCLFKVYRIFCEIYSVAKMAAISGFYAVPASSGFAVIAFWLYRVVSS